MGDTAASDALLLPRLLMLEALSDKFYMFCHVLDTKQWDSLYLVLSSLLSKVWNEVSACASSDELLENIVRLHELSGRAVNDEEDVCMLQQQDLHELMMDVVGAHAADLTAAFSRALDDILLVYLQESAPAGLVELIKSYMPRKKQSWRSFLEFSVSEEELRVIEPMLGDEPSSTSTVDGVVRKLTMGVSLIKDLLDRLAIQPTLLKPASTKLASYKLAAHLSASVKRKREATMLSAPPLMLQVQLLIPTKYQKEKVFFATDRMVTADGEYTGTQREAAKVSSITSLHYGVVSVAIPTDKRAQGDGWVNNPNKNQEADPLYHVVVLAVDATMQGSHDVFLQQINAELNPNTLSSTATASKDVVIYIHGFNNSFKDSVRRAAQLKYDLALSGAIISYSWSASSGLLAYSNNEDSVKNTVGCLTDFIKMCMTKVKGGRLHVLAHSMGNRALIGALKELYGGNGGKGWLEAAAIAGELGCPLKNAILAAADEDPKKFEEMLEVVMACFLGLKKKQEQMCRPVFSVYCSGRDRALTASWAVHGGAIRLGDRSSFFKSRWNASPEWVDVIDATEPPSDFYNHSYFGDSSTVLTDLRNLIDSPQAQLEDTRAHTRSLLYKIIQEKSYEGKVYYNLFPPKAG